MPLNKVTSPEAVLQAVQEFDRIGRDAFLAKYGFARSRGYFLHHGGKAYDSKAILGAARGYQYPSLGPLGHEEFSGGELATARVLRSLGFDVFRSGSPAKVEDTDKKAKNPPWNRDELILALDAYVRWEGKPPNKGSMALAALSAAIGAVRRSITPGGSATLRNVNGTYMKTMNFRRFDPQFRAQGKVGLKRGNKLEKAIWDEFAGSPARLREAAEQIRARLESAVFPTSAEEDLEALPPERREYVRELAVRNRRHVADLKALYGGRCQITGELVLGGLAGDLTEVHHIDWLTRGGADAKSNMVVLAPDFHAAIHAAETTFDWTNLAFQINGEWFPLRLNRHLRAKKKTG